MSSSVALALIARDEGSRLGRCLASADLHVDRMVVVDTGSVDDTMAVAAAHGARVHRIEWPGDFAAARNASLELAAADWHLVLDADEWLLDPPAHVAAVLAEATSGEPFIGLVCQVNRFDLDGRIETAPCWIPRLLPRDVRYAGRVHEQPVSDLPRRRIDLRLGHDGYLRTRLESKRGRNAALLLAALRDDPDDAYLWFQLGKEHAVYDAHDAALPAYGEALRRTPVDARYRHDLVVRMLFSLKVARRFDEALALAADEMPHWSQSPDYHFALGDLCLDVATARPGEALERWLPMAQAAWERCLEIGDQPQLEGTVLGRGSFLAAHNLAVIHEGLGRRDEAARLRRMSRRLREQVREVDAAGLPLTA